MTDKGPTGEVDINGILDSIISSAPKPYEPLLEIKRKADLLHEENVKAESVLKAPARIAAIDRRVDAKFNASGATASNSFADRGPLNKLDADMRRDRISSGDEPL